MTKVGAVRLLSWRMQVAESVAISRALPRVFPTSNWHEPNAATKSGSPKTIRTMITATTPQSDSERTASPVRVLYSFPFKIGAERICNTAWHQVAGVAEAGADVMLFAGSVARALPDGVRIRTTLSIGRLRIPSKLFGRNRICAVHDWQVARWLRTHHREIDVVHVWPGSALLTIREAKRHGIPVLSERPNAHTGYAYEAAAAESKAVGIELPAGHDHQFNRRNLDIEEREYQEVDYLLCPSEFVAQTFRDRGFRDSKLLRHHYGFDEKRFAPGLQDAVEKSGLVALYAGVCEPRKGLHYALEAWLASTAKETGIFQIAGRFVPGYREKLKPMLSHPSVKVLGHRNDLPQLMRGCDLFILSSVEEGSALVTYEAMASGCVLLVSDASGAPCVDRVTGLVHRCRDVAQLTEHLNLMADDRLFLQKIRQNSLQEATTLSWKRAGAKLLNAYNMSVERPSPRTLAQRNGRGENVNALQFSPKLK